MQQPNGDAHASVKGPGLTRLDVCEQSTTAELVLSTLERDGAVILKHIITPEQAAQIRQDLKPSYDADAGDQSGFFPNTTRRALGLLGKSPGCVELACHPLFTEVASQLLTSEYHYWIGQERQTATSRPQISSTVGFQVNPGSRQQGLHRDAIDYHMKDSDALMMLGLVTAVTKTTQANGATIVIPGSHKWEDDRCPHDEEAVAGELDPGDAMLFLGTTYHAGGANTTKDEARETVGIFLCKGMYRQVENQYLTVPLDKVKELPIQAQRLLGYGISPPFCGFATDYKDPMQHLFGVVDEQTIVL